MRSHTVVWRIATTWLLALALLPLHASADQVPYVPTPMNVVDAMLSLANVGPKDMVFDLGSGDGRIVIEAARRYGARAVGIELDPALVAKSQAAAKRAGVADRATFLRQDIFLTDFQQATVLTLYLLPDVNLQLRPRILFELRPGTRIVSHDWDMDDWEPDRTLVIEAPDKPIGGTPESRIYLWTVPARLAGQWRGTLSGPQGEEPVRTLSATLWLPRASMAGEGRLQGAAGTLRLKRSGPLGPGSLEFRLRSADGRIEGEALDGAQRYVLKAKRILN